MKKDSEAIFQAKTRAKKICYRIGSLVELVGDGERVEAAEGAVDAGVADAGGGGGDRRVEDHL